jgi:hypothetical protein
MSSELNIYKKNRITELTNGYNTNLRSLTNVLNNNIAAIKRSNQSTVKKNTLINTLLKSYNINLDRLKINYNQNVVAIQNFIPKNITLTKKKYAILIGINYTGTPNELYGCINDANSIKEYITNKGGFNSINVITDLTNVKATRANILNALKQTLQTANSGDFVFLFYSGHGSYTLDRSGDETTGYDQMIIPSDFNAIVDDELKTIIQSGLKKDVTLFAMFDSCFSGTVLDLKYQYLDSLNYDNYTENNKQLETVGNVMMISGCTDYQTSTETVFNGKDGGALTWCFLEALKQTPNCTWRELVKSMRAFLKEKNLSQIPQFSCGLFENFDSKIFL